MKKTDTKPTKKKETESPLKIIRQETKHGIYAIVCLLFAFFFVIAAFHKGGVAGDFVYNSLTALFGLGYILVPLILTLLGITFLKSERPNLATIHTISALIFFLSGLGILDLLSVTARGGIIGHAVGFPFVALFETFAGVIFLTAILVISLLVLFDVKPDFSQLSEWFKNKFKKSTSVAVVSISDTADYTETSEEESVADTEDEKPLQEESRKSTKEEKDTDDEFEPVSKSHSGFKFHGNYVPPPLSLLEQDRGKANVGDIKANANIIKRTLLNFGIEVEMDEVTIGPTVTRYALKPAVGVKLSRIVGLQNDMAMALAAHPIRIEAPIPGKSLVGIEIPNKTKSTVGLGTLLADEKFKNASKALTVAIGRDISGRAHFANMAKMPHALIAGTTGSGKSVTIHTIITSLLYRNSPDDLKLIFVDPKRVELTLYNKIPHLLTPVITDAKKCILALKWAAKEMDRRYDILQAESVRDIESYHNQIKNEKSKAKDEEAIEGIDPLPYIVIIIDELADIMQTYPRELEAAIVRLAQMSRAVGIHLILSTQRPEVNVITGLIKANVPTRIALRVPTQVDSRTILDSAGAEKLLGAGDMLYADGEGQPRRLQSAFISEEEVKNVVKYLVQAFKDEVPDTIELSGPVEAVNSIFSSMVDGGQDADDELYEQARQIVIESGKASTSYLQRKLGVGYARAARLIDILEERGVVGPGNGSKARDVLEKTMTQEQAGSGDEMN